MHPVDNRIAVQGAGFEGSGLGAPLSLPRAFRLDKGCPYLSGKS